nr:unnamed protein product [Callosobruchus analis]
MLNGVAIAWHSNVAYYLSLEATDFSSKITQLLKNLLSQSDVRIKIFDAKEQIKMLRNCLDVQFNAKVDDPKVADWILDPDAKEKNLLAMMVNYFPEGTKLAQLAGRCKGMGSIGLDISGSVEPKKRSAIEAVLTWHLVDTLKKRLEDVKLSYLDIYDLETDVIVCLSRMELNGIGVKKSVFQELEATLKAQLAAIERKAYSLAGRPFAAPEGWCLLSADYCQLELRILTHLSQDPLLISISCRKAFAAPEGWCLLSADYCQLELRILTHLSQDPLLVSIMRQPGDDVDDRMRQHTKHLCYGIIYGMGAKALSEQQEIEEEDALAFMETFKNTYPALKTFIKQTVERCRKNGYVETLTGRRRYLPNINDDTDATKKGQAERQAVNSVVQGSAADIAKKAMITVQREFQKAFRSSKAAGGIPKLVLQLHDELLYEVPATDKHLRQAASILKTGMERSVRLSVPFPVKLKTGPNWAELVEYTL